VRDFIAKGWQAMVSYKEILAQRHVAAQRRLG